MDTVVTAVVTFKVSLCGLQYGIDRCFYSSFVFALKYMSVTYAIGTTGVKMRSSVC